ncbi:TonB-dependent receptor [Reichenbachiella versicolor]|uniref:TonB-dependent receptor n=1 Tax=Reichenbachiella versicolor TaxID=1821036 RepID=UPI000D6E1C6B|nr:TonB-dependent receptor [Reichenbachiella versicolor]
MKNKLLLLVIFHWSMTTYSQEQVRMAGYVKDGTNGEDLIGATVLIKESGLGSVTNLYGFYSIVMSPGDYTIKVSYVGYQTYEKQISIHSDETLNIELTPEADLLGEVVVSAEALNQNVTKNEMSTAKISAATVKQIPSILGEPDVIRSLQLMPGITTVGDGASGFNVRGGSADQNLILLDEGLIYSSSHLLGLFSTINVDATKDVKVYKGGIPARYGGRLSSVLDIRQKEGNLKEFSGEGGVSLISARILAEGPIVKDKGSYMIAARRSYGDALLRLAGNKNTAYFYDLNMKTNYRINERNRVFLSGYFGRDRFDLDGIVSNGWGNATGTLRWNTVLTNRLFINVSAIYSNYDYIIDDLVTGAENRLTSNIINYHLTSNLTYYLGGDGHLEFGVDQRWHLFKPGEIEPLKGSGIAAESLDEKHAVEQGSYLSYNETLGKLSFNIGVRYSRFARTGSQSILSYENENPVVYNNSLQRYESGVETGTIAYDSNENIRVFNNWEPRLGLTYVINDQQSVKMSYNRMYQYLHLISNTTAPTPLDIWAPSGPYIEPQMADQYAIGYFRNTRDNRFEFSAELYYKKIKNMVDYIDGADIFANNQIETVLLNGDGRAYGLELFLKKKTGRLTGWISYTLSRSQRKVLGLQQGDQGINEGRWYSSNFDKPHDLSMTAIYDLSKRWTFSGNFIFASGAPTTYPKGRYSYAGIFVPHYQGRNQERLPAYHRLDLSVTMRSRSKKGKESHSEWVFGLYNAYGRKNANSIFFKEDEENRGETKSYKSYQFGITPNITYNFKF